MIEKVKSIDIVQQQDLLAAFLLGVLSAQERT